MKFHSLAKNESRVGRLAQRLAEDIRCRRLREGDQYMTATEVASSLDVSTTVAHRALRLLADERIVVRRRNAGTFIGPSAESNEDVQTSTIYHLSSVINYENSASKLGLLIKALRKEFGLVNLQLCWIPEHGSVDFVRKLLADAGGQLAGVIADSCPQGVYRYLDEVKLPTVVSGTLYLGDPQLPSVDHDNREAGRLVVRYLLERGHRRIAVLGRTDHRPGDNDFLEGINAAMDTGHGGGDSVLMRMVPDDPVAVEATSQYLLELADRPTGFITWDENHADILARVAAEHELRIPDDIEIVSISIRGERSPYPHVFPLHSHEEVAVLVGRMMRQLVDDKPLEEIKAVIPVKLLESEEILHK
ncbi:MAG: substrate-binding domain-containing protein [Pirellulales bacterium]|nr:substrate-binding domain-containing protein [Pirellulales bacterium]